MQCDIDILGEPGILAEIELILATTAMLGKLNFQNFTVCINDRNILKAMAAYSGFKEEDYDEVFIVLDKMDKIGKEGVAAELQELGYGKESVEAYLGLFDEVTPDVEGIRYLKEKLGSCLHLKRGRSQGSKVWHPVRPDAGKRTVLLYRDDIRGDDGRLRRFRGRRRPL